MSVKEKLDWSNIPQHVAIIMDGNGRWAKEKGQMRLVGHATGVEAVREALTAASELKVKYRHCSWSGQWLSGVQPCTGPEVRWYFR